MSDCTKCMLLLPIKRVDKKGFTLIELLIVIAIIVILAVFGFSNYLNSIKSGKDGKRKTDLQTIQRALEAYYLDNQAYPAAVGNAVPNTGGAFCHPSGCATATYLQKLPTDTGGTAYYYISAGPSYQLYSCIENANDSGPNVKQAGYAGTNCGSGSCNPCKYGIASTNTNP